MPVDEKGLDWFRLQTRLNLIESLVMRLSLLMPQSLRGLSSQERLEGLQTMLDERYDEIAPLYGQGLDDDPALTALYMEELREVVDRMKQKAAAIAATM